MPAEDTRAFVWVRGSLWLQIVCQVFHFTAHVCSDEMTTQSENKEAQLPRNLFNFIKRRKKKKGARYSHTFMQWDCRDLEKERSKLTLQLSNHALSRSEIKEGDFRELNVSPTSTNIPSQTVFFFPSVCFNKAVLQHRPCRFSEKHLCTHNNPETAFIFDLLSSSFPPKPEGVSDRQNQQKRRKKILIP